METFDFQEALSYIKCGLVVGLTINSIERRYYLNQFGEIMCTPNGKKHLTYVCHKMHMDSILSNSWYLVD